MLMIEFPELNDIVVSQSLFSKLSYDRKTEEYRTAIDLAKLILLNYMPNLKYSRNNNVLALMFDMNKLWEEYVYIELKRKLGAEYSVLAQNTKHFWHSNTVGLKTIRPDIVVMDQKDKKCVAVLDTKWKCPKDGKPSDADLKQMYVYHKYWHTHRTALLYPGSGYETQGEFFDSDNNGENLEKCSMIFLQFLEDKPGLDIDSVNNFLNTSNGE